MKKKMMIICAVTVVALCAVCLAAELPANNKPVEITAGKDGTMSYNTKTNIATADGDVRMVQGDAVITGKHAEYNQKTMDGKITGGVVARKDKAVLTCNEARIFKQDQIVALGNVIAEDKGYRFASERLEYFITAGRVYAPLASLITSVDGTVRAGKIEYFPKTEQGKAWDGVRIDSPKRQIRATAQKASYQGGADGLVVLSGKAHAVQGENVLDSDELKYYVQEDCFVADGNTKVVYYPNSQANLPPSQ